MGRRHEYDFFIAHAGADLPVAASLYEELAPNSRVFLDEKCLRPGDDWDKELSEAQRRSLVSIVLVSENSRNAYYQREEVAAAIDLARRKPNLHRVVPVYLNGLNHTDERIPYGLRLKHGIAVNERHSTADAAAVLLGDLERLDRREKNGVEAKQLARTDFERVYASRLTDFFEHWSRKYTDLRLTTSVRVGSYGGQRSGRKRASQQWWFNDLFTEDRDDFGERIVVLGDPGAGKTTACQRAAWDLAARISQDPLAALPMPVFFPMSTYQFKSRDASDLSAYDRVVHCLAHSIEELLHAYQGMPVDTRLLSDSMRERPYAFFLDGLNEGARKQRNAMMADVCEFARLLQGTHHRLILTTRKLDYEYDLAKHLQPQMFRSVEILDLDSAGMSEFVMRDLGELAVAMEMADKLSEPKRAVTTALLEKLRRWDGTTTEDPLNLLASEFPDGDAYRKAVTKLADAQALLSLLRKEDYSRVLWLAQNPSTLRDIVEVHRAHGEIPRSRIRLFEQAIRTRLRLEAARQGGRIVFKENDKLDVLQDIAIGMHGLSIEEDRAREICFSYLRDRPDADTAADALLDQLYSTDYLLVHSSPTTLAFVKQPYQEYFVARGLRKRWRALLREDKAPWSDPDVRPYFEDPVWLQTTASMAGLLEVDELECLVLRLWQRRSMQRLAALCVRQATELPMAVVDNFKEVMRRRIHRYTLMPSQVAQVGLGLLFVFLFVFNYVVVIDTANPVLAVRRMLDLPLGGALFAAVWSTVAITIFALLRFASRVDNNSVGWLRTETAAFSIALIGCWVLFGDWLGPGPAALVAVLSGIALVILFVRLLFFFMGPVAEWLTEKFEDRIVVNGLIPSLEVLRDMGPDSASLVMQLQETIAGNHFVSDRIKDVIELTWALSPKTVLLVLETIDQPKHQAEGVRILESVVLRSDIKTEYRERSVAALLKVAENPAVVGSGLGAVRVLKRIAIEKREYIDEVTQVFRSVVLGTSAPLAVRRGAWRAARDLGLALPWPRGAWGWLGQVIGATLLIVLLWLILRMF